MPLRHPVLQRGGGSGSRPASSGSKELKTPARGDSPVGQLLPQLTHGLQHRAEGERLPDRAAPADQEPPRDHRGSPASSVTSRVFPRPASPSINTTEGGSAKRPQRPGELGVAADHRRRTQPAIRMGEHEPPPENRGPGHPNWACPSSD